MKIFKLLAVCLFSSFSALSQVNGIKEHCEKEINKLNEKYVAFETHFKSAEEKLDSLIQKLNKSVTGDLLEAIEEKNELKSKYKDSIVDVITEFKHYKAVCNFKDEELKKLFNHPKMEDYLKPSENVAIDSSEENSVYLYFGENKVISEEILTKNNKQTEILKEIISDKVSENYLGDITIPKDEEEFFFYEYIKKSLPLNNQDEGFETNKNTSKDKKEKADEKIVRKFIQSKNASYKFKSVHVEISDAVFSDIRVIVETSDGNTHIFENQIGVSILRFSAGGKKNYLFYKHSIKKGTKSDKFKDKGMNSLYVKLSDVFVYDYKLGNNFAPSDLVLELPVKDADGNYTNKNSFATYKIKEDSHISGIVELRAYTDFLALFGDSDNGLVQIEGKADFHILPFPMSMFGNSNLMEFKFLNKVSPKINYSRFDEDTRYIVPILNEEDQSLYIEKELDLIEKRYLTMGIDLDVLQLKRKGVPFVFDLSGNLNYQLSELNFQDNIHNVKAVSYGPLAKVSFKKFNNFGLNYTASFSWYDYKNYNEGLEGILPEKFRVFSNEFEVFYFPTGNQNQSIFVRLRTFNNSEPKNNEAFYQFQFGYRFAIGTKSIKKP